MLRWAVALPRWFTVLGTSVATSGEFPKSVPMRALMKQGQALALLVLAVTSPRTRTKP